MALTFRLVDTWDDGKRIHGAGAAATTGDYATGGRCARPLAVCDRGRHPNAGAGRRVDGQPSRLRLRFHFRLSHQRRQSKSLPTECKRRRFPPKLAAGADCSSISNDTITFYLRIFRHRQGRELKASPAILHVSPAGSYFASALSSLITNIDVFISCPLASW